MKIVVDPDVQKVLEFMQANIPASKLQNVAKGVADLAYFAWGHFDSEDLALLRLQSEPILADDPHTQSSASEHRLVA